MARDTPGVSAALCVADKSTMAARKLVPLLDRVLVEKILPQAKSAGGVLLPESVASRTHEGRVLAVGPGRYSRDGERMPVSVQEGETVLLPEFGGNQVKVDGKEYVMRTMRIAQMFRRRSELTEVVAVGWNAGCTSTATRTSLVC